MSTKLPGTNIHSIHFAGTCKHCSNDTLMYISELNIHSCAYCHKENTESDDINLTGYKPESTRPNSPHTQELTMG